MAPFGDELPPLAEAREALRRAMTAIESHELELSRQLLAGLSGLRGVRLYGLATPEELGQRVPTFGFTLAGTSNLEVAERLGESGIFVWAGHHYARTLMDRLGLGELGVIRVGAVHYNTSQEVTRLLGALDSIAR